MILLGMMTLLFLVSCEDETTPDPAPVTWASVSGGRWHTLAIKTDGTLWAWGMNNYGQLGLGNSGEGTNRNTPTQVGADLNWSSVSGGMDHTVAIKTDGTLWAWGHNAWGQLGLGHTTPEPIPTPTQVLPAGLPATGWSFVSAGWRHTIALRTDGTLWAWGLNAEGQLGLGHRTNTPTPTQVLPGTTWLSVYAGAGHTLAIRPDGTLWSWGGNHEGQLGLGHWAHTPIPTQVLPAGLPATGWASVSGGDFYTIAIRTDGTLWAWGMNTSGQLGLGHATHIPTPTHVLPAGLPATGWSSVSAGWAYTLSIRTDGTLWAWGVNVDGRLGLGHATLIPTLTPTQVVLPAGTPTTNWSSVSVGERHTLAIRTDGTLWAWGWNWFGQLGLGDTTNRNTPTQIP